MLDFFRPKADESRIEIIATSIPTCPAWCWTARRFTAALLNLVLNAQQAMPKGGQLVLAHRPTADGVALDLIDTGCGMDAETQAKIFETFFSTKPGGSGLGLPTTRKIIEAHGGQITVESEVGRGTKFTIELPVPPRLAAAPAG